MNGHPGDLSEVVIRMTAATKYGPPAGMAGGSTPLGIPQVGATDPTHGIIETMKTRTITIGGRIGFSKKLSDRPVVSTATTILPMRI